MNTRNTHQKEIIQSIILGKGHHMHAEDVLFEAKKIDENIGLATVYRNLNNLVEKGKIQKIEGNGYSYYDGNPIPHDHFICTKCGRLFDVEDDYDKKMDRKIEKLSQFRIIKHFTTYEGICKECLERLEGEQSWN